MTVIQNTIYLSFIAFLFSSSILVAAEDSDNSQCCSCAFTETKVFEPTGDFPCSFEYPAGWKVRYIPFENAVDIRAPRCESRCGGGRSLVFSVAQSKNSNAEVHEGIYHQLGVPVGRAECGGRAVTFFESAETKKDDLDGMIGFFVGKHDGKDYDARVIISCPNPGEWREIEKLFINTLR